MLLVVVIVVAIIVIIIATTIVIITEQKYKELETEVLKELGFSNWGIISYLMICNCKKSSDIGKI